jgi:hypothetical protein
MSGDDAITIAINRFAHAHARVRNLSAGLPDDEIVIAYEERTEALLGLIRWDEADPVAAAILALVRAQDRLRGHSDSTTTCRDLSPAQAHEHDRALADRDTAILRLMEAGLRTEDWNRRRAGSAPFLRLVEGPRARGKMSRPSLLG